MLNPGNYVLCNRAITAALNNEVQTAVDGLEGMKAGTLKFQLAYGSGGTTIRAYVRVSLDGGTTFMDVACFFFLLASATRVINLSGLTPVTTPIVPSDGALADNTFVDGIIGSIWQVKLLTTGNYVNTNVLINLEAR